jgi:hypothetical protein
MDQTIIKQNTLITCGCCGLDFYTWHGYEDQDQDSGYGICSACQTDIPVKYKRLYVKFNYHTNMWETHPAPEEANETTI